MNDTHLILEPTSLLNENWEFDRNLPITAAAAPFVPMTEESKWLHWLHRTRIKIPKCAMTAVVNTDEKFRYLKTEVAVNIMVPKGHIQELRIHIDLNPQESVVVMDGFPNKFPHTTPPLQGTISVALDKLFKFIPGAEFISDLIDIKLGPWEFAIGNLWTAEIVFSGALGPGGEWYFRDKGINGDIRLALTLRVPLETGQILGDIRAAWLIDPGFLRQARLGTESLSIQVYGANKARQ